MENEPIVTINEGKLKGKVGMDFYGTPYYSFRGIPYAEAPIGKLRFKAPKSPIKWDGIRDATVEGKTCYSSNLQTATQSEDCLFLNIYTPSLTAPLKPVMFWIHGGGYVKGSGSTDVYGPDYLIAENVVIVTFNYRLGILGFLSLNDPSLEVPGNAGLKDQVMALRWVRDNIAEFGGDPNNVTIFGESVGGGSVHFLMLSPLSKGLFHKAIIQSGSALGNRGRGQYSTPLLAKALNLENCDDEQILNILRDMPVDKIVDLQEKVPDKYQVKYCRPFGAVVEKYTNADTFLFKDPLDVITMREYHNVPIIVGYTSREGYFVRYKYKKKQIDGDFEEEIPFSLNVEKGSEKSKNIAMKIKQFFYGDQEPSTENSNAFYLLQTDNMFVRSIYNTARYHSRSSKFPVYLYRVSIESRLNLTKRHYQITDYGVTHGDDLGYLFKNVRTPKICPGSIEENGIKTFVKLWTSFAKTGDPNPASQDPLINVIWKAVKQDEMNFLDIGENLTVGVNPERTRMRFWDEIEKICLKEM
ncbi:hypothetical protein RI129_006614 [Pyrocoelia pectoralis]|uniref:Carboxylesterase type B domain-containing protein n=1 Tax=Pyrocoelia pectoralis TaxID=417401 RepID=A0AAN7VK12_9COLE